MSAFFEEIRLCQKGEEEWALDVASSPNENLVKDGKLLTHALKRGYLLYSGMSKESIFNRIKEHLDNKSINGCPKYYVVFSGQGKQTLENGIRLIGIDALIKGDLEGL